MKSWIGKWCFFGVLLFALSLNAQNKVGQSKYANPKTGQRKIFKKCYTVENEHFLKQENSGRATDSEFEYWLAPFVARMKEERRGEMYENRSRIIKIPVVVHVVHSGEEIGEGANIADEQVLSQIEVLNQDFRRKKDTPGFNDSPIGADVEIEFCLAKRTPDGKPTNGIDRIDSGMEAYTNRKQIQEVLKPNTIWDPERYCNVWTLKIGGEGDWAETLGYAQFPAASELTGLNKSQKIAETDGLVINYYAFGSRNTYPEGEYMLGYDEGRTTTHEMGHWLGLRHIWGDGGCDVDDFCADTPVAGKANYDCEEEYDSCPGLSGLDMTQNYMDYAEDACVNIFTKEQKFRMRAVMHHAIRRASLRLSDACIPLSVRLDGGISIEKLNVLSCTDTIAPAVILKNNGTERIVSAVIGYGIDEEEEKMFYWEGDLRSNASVVVGFSSLITGFGEHTFYVRLNSVNGREDGFPENNEAGETFVNGFQADKLLFVLQKDYFGAETTWTLTNSAGTQLYSGGPYFNTSQTSRLGKTPLEAPIEEIWHLPDSDCYTFAISDSGSDGINGRKGEGYFRIETEDHIPVIRGGYFKSVERYHFAVSRLNKEDFSEASLILLYPNPTRHTINLVIPSEFGLPDNWAIFNSRGQKLMDKTVSSEKDLIIDVSILETGIYFVRINKSEMSKMLKFLKK